MTCCIFGTGNGTPWNARSRDPDSNGDNLYLASIIAVKPDTGEYVWHYQTAPRDTWDYDAVSPMMVVNLKFDGADRRVVVQPNKNGMLYVLDAATGKLISGDAFTEVNWNTGIDMKTGRPIETKDSRYPKGTTFNLAPGVQGGHGWHSNAFSPETGLIYIPTQHAYFPLAEMPYYGFECWLQPRHRLCGAGHLLPEEPQSTAGLRGFPPGMGSGHAQDGLAERDQRASGGHSAGGKPGRRHPGWRWSDGWCDGHGWWTGVRWHGRQG